MVEINVLNKRRNYLKPSETIWNYRKPPIDLIKPPGLASKIKHFSILLKLGTANKSSMLNSIAYEEFVNFDTFAPLGQN